MTERPDLPLSDGERREDAAERRYRVLRWRCVVGGCCLSLLPLTALDPPLPRLVWNASASAPLGLYAVAPDAWLARGDMVIAWAPRPARALAARRHYLPLNVPLVKRIVGVAGDRVCATGNAIFVNRKRVAVRLKRDAAGRSMPSWRGCQLLGRGRILLLMDAPASFDGRYFGPTARDDIIGRATPLWTWS